MRTVNMEDIRSYDKIKDNIFHAKKQQFKQNLRKKIPKTQPKTIKKIIPWKFIIKSTIVGSLIYLSYNYTNLLIHQAITNSYITVLDYLAIETVKEDFLNKSKSLIRNPMKNSTLQKFANNFYKLKLEEAIMGLQKKYVDHLIRQKCNSRQKIWILNLNNNEDSLYVNKYGDLIQKQQNSFIKIWKLSIWKTTSYKVIEQDRFFKYYRILNQTSTQNNQSHIYQSLVTDQCQKINILNRFFSSEYQSLLIECKKNIKYGQKINNIIQKRLKQFPYSNLKTHSHFSQNQTPTN